MYEKRVMNTDIIEYTSEDERIEIHREEYNEFIIRSQEQIEEYDFESDIASIHLPLMCRFGFIMRKEIEDFEARDDYMYWFEGKILDIIQTNMYKQSQAKHFIECITQIQLSPPIGSKFLGGELYLKNKENFEMMK